MGLGWTLAQLYLINQIVLGDTRSTRMQLLLEQYCKRTCTLRLAYAYTAAQMLCAYLAGGTVKIMHSAGMMRCTCCVYIGLGGLHTWMAYDDKPQWLPMLMGSRR
jgi:hypothetical protein